MEVSLAIPLNIISARYFQEVKICQISISYRFAGLFIEFFLEKNRLSRDGERSYRESIFP